MYILNCWNLFIFFYINSSDEHLMMFCRFVSEFSLISRFNLSFIFVLLVLLNYMVFASHTEHCILTKTHTLTYSFRKNKYLFILNKWYFLMCFSLNNILSMNKKILTYECIMKVPRKMNFFRPFSILSQYHIGI